MMERKQHLLKVIVGSGSHIPIPTTIKFLRSAAQINNSINTQSFKNELDQRNLNIEF